MTSTTAKSNSWLVLAVASGACAAFNGVFAKLTTTELTASWSGSIAHAFGLSSSNKLVEYAIRGLFFGLNILFNAVMWGLFTHALTLASSTVRVSVINTSANFMITAILGLAIFSESLPGLWWLGAAMLVAGSVIIGGREEGVKEADGVVGSDPLLNGEGAVFRDEDEHERDDVELNSVRDGDNSSDDEDGVLK
ncbi:hypothetical protein PMIN06_006990 [Paraphaeosphaeria minitans]|uniref:Transmembrane protein 42 n=1 Tax=Paraphaeosphaeria minitans TaxID=565426 RepID=A0A9P6GPN9_9PLEO|nr:hypothetical protein PMIN01_02185 [Paraphaeosphaeria minitans]